MPRPHYSDNLFGTSQRIQQTVTIYNTPHTVESQGIIYRPATATDTFGSGISFSTATLSALNSHFNSNTIPGVVNSLGNEEEGRIPVIYNYWGTGAPIGVRRANSAALRFTGYVRESGSYGFCAFGRGTIKIFHEGSTVFYGPIDENNPRISSLLSLSAGDKIDIFFWAVDVAWAGLGIRVFTDPSAIEDDGSVNWEVMRDAPVLSASFMDDGQGVPSFVLRDVDSMEIRTRAGQVRTADISIPLSSARSSFGWKWDSTLKKLVNSGESQEIRLGDLVKASGGVLGDEHSLITGNVVDIVPGDTHVTVRVTSVEGRLTQHLSENFPDRLSYAAFGYTRRSGASEPVWSVPAYDHWPYEYALRDLFLRGWIDHSLLEGKRQVRRVGQSQSQEGSALFRIRTPTGDLLRLKRQANYGNPRGARTDRPDDDQYLYPSELTRTLYNRITTLVDTIGYDFGSTEDGYLFVRPRNNANQTLAISGGTEVTNPSAIGGTYQSFTGSGWTATTSGITAGRIDLVVGRAPGLGTVAVKVTRAEDGAEFNTTINLSHSSEVFYHDKVYDNNFDNIATYSVLSGQEYGTYMVQITPVGGSGSTEYRLDALRVFDMDPERPTEHYHLTNLKNITGITGNSNFPERINDAIVTGKRKVAITDSAKAIEQVETEFITSRATDTNAILNPQSLNYMGRKITAFLSNESIGSQDLSDWAAQNLVAHYRMPSPDATVEHTILPTLEIRDPIRITDIAFDAFDGNEIYYVVGYTHSIAPDRATTRIELSAFPETPSYEPKEDVDISLYRNKPVINVDISYPSLGGTSTVSNPGEGLAVQSDLVVDTGTVGFGNLLVTPGAVSPGTELLYIPTKENVLSPSPTISYSDMAYFKNNPYHKFYSKSGSNLSLNFQMADGSSEYAPAGWHVFPDSEFRFSSHIIQDPYSGAPPFYDPYYSELSVPELVTITFDGLVSGYYRVSVVDARDPSSPVTVAWLTQADLSSNDPEDHWEYRESASGMRFYWDGVDNIGEWNRTQTEEYSWRQQGNFDSVESPLIGRGYYAANDQSTGMTHISGEMSGTDPAYPIGNYAQFFLRIEVLRDIDDSPLMVETNGEEEVLDTSATPLPPRYIYYHLPPPNKATISIQDWDTSGGNYNPTTGGSSWGSMDANATFRDNKPVKITITPEARKGAKFAADDSHASMKIHRVAHLGANVYDLSAIFFGRKWNEVASSPEEKRVVSRRFTVDDYTMEINDDSFGEPTSSVEWIFYPSQFKQNFGYGESSIRYGDYLQLAEVPSWNPKRLPGEERSRSILVMMNYLFYLSVYTQDRSGRLVWAIDPTFVDRSKILTNTEPTEFPSDVERHQRRTIYVRQWWDPDKMNEELGAWNIPAGLQGGFADVWDYRHGTGTIPIYPNAAGTLVWGTGVTGVEDIYTRDLVNRGLHQMMPGGNTARDLGTLAGGLGNWRWENDDAAWVPNISRDFHPFYVVPPMALAGYEGSYWAGRGPVWRHKYLYALVDYRGNGIQGDEARFDSWFTILNNYNNGTLNDIFFMGPGRTMEEWYTRALTGRPTEDLSQYMPVLPHQIAYQRQDDIKHYEMIRGGYSNGAGKSRDLSNVLGGDPYYQNVKLYRYFRMGFDTDANLTTRWYNDVDRTGWFHVTFRHTYNWESSSLFPVDEDKFLVPGAIDADITGSPLTAYSYDPGAYTGWKDDHPSPMQQGTWQETGTCSTIHWRNDRTNHGFPVQHSSQAGGTCGYENPTVALPDEELPHNYKLNQNIFVQRYVSNTWRKVGNTPVYDKKNYMPLAVGPRLPETRRSLFRMVLLNNRRNSPL